jgi:uncharacterized protein
VIDLLHIPQEGVRVEGRTELLRLEGADLLRDLEWNLRLLPSDSDVFVEVHGTATLESCCSRCLEPIERTLRVDSQFLGSKDTDLVARGAHTLGTQDLDVVFFPEPLLDESVIVAEQFQLQVPMHPLCKDACEGLCPQCGKNWNKGRCQCRPELQKEPSALAKALSGLKLDLEP